MCSIVFLGPSSPAVLWYLLCARFPPQVVPERLLCGAESLEGPQRRDDKVTVPCFQVRRLLRKQDPWRTERWLQPVPALRWPVILEGCRGVVGLPEWSSGELIPILSHVTASRAHPEAFAASPHQLGTHHIAAVRCLPTTPPARSPPRDCCLAGLVSAGAGLSQLRSVTSRSLL